MTFKKSLLGVALLSLFTTSAYANLTIQKKGNRKLLIKQSEEELVKVGTALVAISDNGDVCELQVVKVQKALALAETVSCTNFNDLRVGQPVEVSHLKPGGNVSAVGKAKHSVAAQLYYSLASSVENTGKVGSVSVSAMDNSEGAIGLGGLYKFHLADNYGLIGGLAYEMGRNLKSRSSGGVTANYNPVPVLSFLWVEANGFYSFQGFNVYGGFNYNFPSLSPSTNTTIGGAIGLQIGADYEITPMFHADLMYRTINFSVAQPSITYDSSRLWGILLRGTAYFDLF